MYSVKDSWFFTMRVSPFGNPRVDAYFQLTAAYRRLSRPSSALSAKAFTLRSFSLEQPFCFFLHSVLRQIETNPAFIAWASQIIVFFTFTLYGKTLKSHFSLLIIVSHYSIFKLQSVPLYPCRTRSEWYISACVALVYFFFVRRSLF